MVEFRIPTREDFPTRQRWMLDPDMMAYSANWDVDFPGYHRESGTIAWPAGQWGEFETELRAPVSERAYYFVTHHDTDVGHAHYRVDGRNIARIGFTVVPSHRGRGLGQAVMATLVQRIWDNTTPVEIHNVFEDERGPARHIHAKAGFVPSKDVHTDHGRPTRNWVLVR